MCKTMKAVFVILVMAAGLTAILSCERENNPLDENAATRGTSLIDSVDSDSGKVRYGNVVVDTSWNGETHINF